MNSPMTFEILLDKAANIAVVRCVGVMDVHDHKRITDALQEDAEAYRGMNLLIDLRQAEPVNDPGKVKIMVASAVPALEALGANRVARLVSRDVDFGVRRMLDSHADLEGMATALKTFREIEDALEWFGLPCTYRPDLAPVRP